jgi:hypothetical protein
MRLPGKHHHRDSGLGALAIADLATLLGAVAGVIAGAIAGPAGAIAGSLIGAAVGAAAGRAIAFEDSRRQRNDERLDREIGVIDGSLGAASPHQPPARVGAYSAASCGAGAALGS